MYAIVLSTPQQLLIKTDTRIKKRGIELGDGKKGQQVNNPGSCSEKLYVQCSRKGTGKHLARENGRTKEHK